MIATEHPQADFDTLKRENEILKQRIAQLENQCKSIHHVNNDFRAMVFENSYLPTVVMDASSKKLVHCNWAAVKAYGLRSIEETLTKTHEDMSPAVQSNGIPSGVLFLQYTQKALNEGAFVFEWLHKKMDGTLWEAEVHLLPFEVNQKTYLQFSLVDITHRKKEKRTLLESQAKLKAIIESSMDSIWAIDTEYRINYINNRFYHYFLKTFGVELKKGLNIVEALPFSLQGKWKQRIDEATKRGNRTYTDKIEGRDGCAYTEISVNPIIVDEEVVGLTFFGKDISQKKCGEIKLAESNKMRDLIINNIPSYIFWKDIKSTYMGCNQLFANAAGITSPEEIVGKTDFDLPWHREQTEHYIKVDQRVLQSGKNEHGIQELQSQASGETIWLETNKTPFIDNEGKTIGILGTCEDITVRKKMEEELIRAKEKAEESDQLKSAFLANMSHEIRTPMNGILGFAELLKTPNLSGEEQQYFINIIEQSGNRMLHIINDLINISKIESGQAEVTQSEFCVNELINFHHNFFLSEASSKGLKLISHCPLSDEKSTMTNDKDKVDAILSNLIKNAIKYTEKGEVRFGYRSEAKNLIFFVKDTGVGIEKKLQKTVFDRFVRLKNNKGNIEGSGLGLSITKGYIDLLGGTIDLESELGYGTTFRFSLPVR